MSLGQRIKNFRTKAGLSQFELEVATELAVGSVSRIENGKINPTKETLHKIASALKLNAIGLRSLFLVSDLPITEEEKQAAIEEVKEYFSDERVVAYLIDENINMVYVSKGMQNFVGFNDQELEAVIGKNILELIFNPEYKVRGLFDKENFKDMAQRQLTRFKLEKRGMEDALWYKELIARLRKCPDFNELYEVEINDPSYVYSKEARTVVFNVNGHKFPLTYSREPLKGNPRFEVIDYFVS